MTNAAADKAPGKLPLYIRRIQGVIRLFMRGKRLGKWPSPDPESPLILLCNHGEWIGPVLCGLYVDIPYRPWTIAMLLDTDKGAEYLYLYTIKKQRFLPACLKHPLASLCVRFTKRFFMDMGCIPVYRDNPVQLRKTMRLTVEALERGENILLFPENPNDTALDKPGYLRAGLGPFHKGFLLPARLFSAKTGRAARFVPLWADKDGHTLTVGEPVVWDMALYDDNAFCAILREKMHTLSLKKAEES